MPHHYNSALQWMLLVFLILHQFHYLHCYYSHCLSVVVVVADYVPYVVHTVT